MLAAIAVPDFVKARAASQMSVCINNLRQIEGAIHRWALEQNKDATAPVAYSDISSYLKSAVICPAGGTTFANSYHIVDAMTKPVCKKLPATHVQSADTAN